MVNLQKRQLLQRCLDDTETAMAADHGETAICLGTGTQPVRLQRRVLW
jgi:hypothetical protein